MIEVSFSSTEFLAKQSEHTWTVHPGQGAAEESEVSARPVPGIAGSIGAKMLTWFARLVTEWS
jgi:hypothetical protein